MVWKEKVLARSTCDYVSTHLRQRSRLLAQVELQVQVVQMEEHVGGDLADRVLCHPRKDRIPQLVETGRTRPGNTV